MSKSLEDAEFDRELANLKLIIEQYVKMDFVKALHKIGFKTGMIPHGTGWWKL